MQNQEAKLLLKKYREQKCSPEELALLESWYEKTDIVGIAGLSAEDWQSIHDSLPPKINTGKTVRIWKRVAVAASILICSGIGFYLYKGDERPKLAAAKNSILPGANKAYLTLASGRRISLADAGNGVLAKEAGLSISKTANGEVIYTVSDNNRASHQADNTISTPNGGQWQVRLPDGSVVFLNAASSLTYPLSFSGAGKRTVTLSGEAYFEVAKDKKHPFVVKTAQQEVEVLGTHFNINSYADEGAIKTTLLEGSVMVSPTGEPGRLIKPGEQAILSSHSLNVQHVDLEEVMSWKNGYFQFNEEGVESVMRKIARWYDVEVEYTATPADEKFNGMISRDKKLEQVLKMLEETNAVKFKIAGRRVMVSK